MATKTTGEIISEYRKAKGLTQRALAEQLNITDKAVSKWERNVARPDISIVPKLSQILDIPVELLIDIPLSTNRASQRQTPDESVPAGANPRARRDVQEEETRAYYAEKVRHLVMKGILGFACGFLFALTVALSDDYPTPFFFSCMVGIFLSGVPYGYEVLGNLIGRWFVVGHAGVTLIVFALKLVGAILISWIAYPIALLYNLAGALRKGSKARLAVIVLLCAVIVMTVLFWCGPLVGGSDKGSNSNKITPSNTVTTDVPGATVSDGSETIWVTSVDEINLDSPAYLQICEDALSKTVAIEKRTASSGPKITSPSVLRAAYFLTVKDSNGEHWDHGNNVKMKNAIVIVASHEVNLMESVTRENYYTWFYPDCVVLDDNNFAYDAESVHKNFLTADGVEGVYNWLCQAYSDMEIHQLSLPE